MRRRTLLASLGVAAAGGAIGTGAFTSVEATRTVDVAIADEDEALLALTEMDPQLVNQGTRNRIQISIDEAINENGGQGVGSRSEYVFDEVFGITNQGTQTVYVESEFTETDGQSGVSPGFYVATTDDLLLGTDAALVVDPGQTAAVGSYLDVSDVNVEYDDELSVSREFNFDATITAEEEEPSDLKLLNNEGKEVDDGEGGPAV